VGAAAAPPPAGAAPGAAGPSAAAAAAAAAPAAAAAGGYFLLRGARHASCAALAAALAPGDVAELHGAVQGPLALRVAGVQLLGRTHDAALLAPRDVDPAAPTLLVTASDVRVTSLRVHGMRTVHARDQCAAVCAAPTAGASSLSGFAMRNVDILGGGAEHACEIDGVRYGHPGVDLCTGVVDALLEDVRVCEVNGDGVLVRAGATATLRRVTVAGAAYIGFWLFHSGACALEDCAADACGEDGAYIDATAPCALRGFAATSCAGPGFVFDATAPPDELDALRAAPHATQRLRCVGNAAYGALLRHGAAACLAGAQLLRNAWNGVRVTAAALPGGGAASAAARRISLAGALLLQNGRRASAAHPSSEGAAVVAERDVHGASRAADIVDVQRATLHGNAGGDALLVADAT
jgi:hypothetical protein